VTKVESSIEKAVGRARKAAGDLGGDSSLRREGARDEKRAEAEDKLEHARETLAERARDLADLEEKG
jgi:uncharacterized protein YjbJ (UPF0337 family)